MSAGIYVALMKICAHTDLTKLEGTLEATQLFDSLEAWTSS